MSSSESSYTWDEWYNRNKQNGKKSGLLDKHQEAYIMKQQRDELLVALQYWLPKELPFPNQPNDTFCQEHNKQWSSARAAIAKATGGS